MSFPIIPNVPQGGDVFIGEQGLDVTSAVGDASTIAWWQSGKNPSLDLPGKQIQVINPDNFYISPSEFVGRYGNWYRLDETGKSQGIVAFVVNDPVIDIKVWDQNKNKDVTGQSVPINDYLNFRVETNLYTIAQQRQDSDTGYVTIKVKTPDGSVYEDLHQSESVTLRLTDLICDSQPYYWVPVPAGESMQGWWTGYTDSTGKKLYKPGTYSVTAESNLNSMKDNYKDSSGNDYTGKTISATKTVGLLTQTASITPAKTPISKKTTVQTTKNVKTYTPITSGTKTITKSATSKIVYVTVFLTPTNTIIPVLNPVIGVWRYSDSNGFDFRFRFNADGTAASSFYNAEKMETISNSGTWRSQGGNSYVFIYSDGSKNSIIYDPSRNAIYNSKFPDQLFYPYQGNMLTPSIPVFTNTPTFVKAINPIIGVWRYIDSYDYEIRYRFNADGKALVSFYDPDTDEASVYSGTWRSQGGNSYVFIYSDGSDEDTLIYDSSKKVLTNPDYLDEVYYPYSGDVMAASYPSSSYT